MSQEAIILLDPREKLGRLREALSGVGPPLRTVLKAEEILEPAGPKPSSREKRLILLDGEPDSGFEPTLAPRFAEAHPELPPVVLAVVHERRRGREWLRAGADGFLLWPMEAEDLRVEVERWLNFAGRLEASTRRLEALRKFFAMFAHDLKNPLNAISCYCELVSAHPQLPEDVREDLSKVRRNVDLVSSMAQGLLEMARGNARLNVIPREAELTSVVREAVEMMRVRAVARGTLLRLHAPAASVPVWIDPPRMIEAMANVLDNAIKFSPDEAHIEVRVTVEGPQVLITIEDEGPGIPASEREEIFDRFAQGTASSHLGGLGLGLAIARDIIQLHHGTISIEDRQPRGTRMGIRIPHLLEPDRAATKATGGATRRGGEARG